MGQKLPRLLLLAGLLIAYTYLMLPVHALFGLGKALGMGGSGSEKGKEAPKEGHCQQMMLIVPPWFYPPREPKPKQKPPAAKKAPRRWGGASAEGSGRRGGYGGGGYGGDQGPSYGHSRYYYPPTEH